MSGSSTARADTDARVDIAIIGMGFSGAALARKLAQTLPRSASLALIDPAREWGRGRSYSDPSGLLRLNVPAARMSVDVDAPDDFAMWLARERGGSLDAARPRFAARADYGRYVGERLRHALDTAPSRIVRVVDALTGIASVDGRWRLTLAAGTRLDAAHVVLATGQAPAPVPRAFAAAGLGAAIIDPLAPHALDAVDRDADLLLIGTGLSAVDALLLLDARGHRGRISCVSRHARWPRAHAAGATSAIDDRPLFADASLITPRRALAALRAAIDSAGHDHWRGVIDALRPHTARVWSAWSLRERERALRHLRSVWDVHRHRMAEAVAVDHARIVADRAVAVDAARITGAALGTDGRIDVRLAPTGCGLADAEPGRAARVVTVDRVLSTLAPVTALSQRGDPLSRALLSRGLARDDALGLGIDATDRFEAIAGDGRISAGLYVLGPALRARDWEATAAPELRSHAAALAGALLRSIADRAGAP